MMAWGELGSRAATRSPRRHAQAGQGSRKIVAERLQPGDAGVHTFEDHGGVVGALLDGIVQDIQQGALGVGL